MAWCSLWLAVLPRVYALYIHCIVLNYIYYIYILQASGMVFFVAGVLSVIVMFPKRVAVLAMLYLSFGDPFASAVGIRLGYLGPKFSMVYMYT